MIVAGLYNQDSSFFEITSSDINDRVISKDIISFSYTEEIQRFNTGTLSIHDPDHFYSKVLRVGANLDISFGYEKQSLSKNTALLVKQNPVQVFGGLSRTGIQAYIQNPSGVAGNNGVVRFNCNFYGKEYLNPKQYRLHTGITKAALVTQLLQEIGCIDLFVNFSRGTELLDQNTQIIQRETNYKFLLKYAREWRVIFKVGYNSKGLMTGLFISPDLIGSPKIAPLMSGAIGGYSVLLEYGQGVGNVIEYTWKNHTGDGGSGDNTRIIYGADGRPTFIRYVTKGDTIKAYKLNQDRIRRHLEKIGDFSDRFIKMKEWLNAQDFEEVKWAFDPIELSTAPQGLGYSMNAKLFGNPLLSAPVEILYGEGFPVFFTPKSDALGLSKFYGKKITHIIDNTGYKCNLEVMDAFTAFGGLLL